MSSHTFRNLYHKFFAGSSFLAGTFLLTAAGLLTRVIGFFFKIFLSRTIGAEGLGIFQLLSPVMVLVFALTSAGIQTSISKFVSMEMGKKNTAGAKHYLFVGLTISLALSFLVSFFIWKNSGFIASSWLGDTRCGPLLEVLALSFVPACIHSCINGYYYGLKKTAVPSFSQLLEQLVRVGTVFILYRICQSENRPVSLTFMVWGIVAGEVASTLFSLSTIHFPAKDGHSADRISVCVKNLFQMALPLTANRVVLNLFASFENIMIPNRLKLFGYTNTEALSVYGILTGMSMSVIMFPSVIINSASVLLLPSVSAAQATHDEALIRRTVSKTIAACLSFGLFCTTCFIFTGKYIGNLLFGNALSGTFIVTLGWICPFLYLTASLCSILHGLGYPGMTFLLNLCACGIRILFVMFAVPRYGIRSYLIGLLASQIVTALLSILILKKITKRNLRC